jgi:hypothetical protein
MKANDMATKIASILEDVSQDDNYTDTVRVVFGTDTGFDVFDKDANLFHVEVTAVSQ